MRISDQNNRITLERLSTYDNYYSKARVFSLLRFAACVVVPVVMAVIKVWYNTIWFTNLLLIYSAFACLLWFVFGKMVAKRRHAAARVLQLTEVELLGTEWNPYFCGSKPLPEEVYYNQRRDLNDFKDWFGKDLDGKSEEEAIVTALKNCVGRNTIGRKWHFTLYCWILGVFEVVLLAAVLVMNYSLNGALTYLIAPSVPLWLWFVSVWEQRKRSAKQLEMIRRMISDEETYGYSSKLNDLIQNYLFLYRDEAWVMGI